MTVNPEETADDTSPPSRGRGMSLDDVTLEELERGDVPIYELPDELEDLLDGLDD